MDDRVVLAVGGHRGARVARLPGVVVEGRPDRGLRSIDSINTELLHAGTAERDGELVTGGGRVLNVTGMGDTPGKARDSAYAAADRIEFDGKQLRRDIAARAVERVRLERDSRDGPHYGDRGGGAVRRSWTWTPRWSAS